MFIARLHRSGDDFVITIPSEVVDHLDLVEGDTITLDIRPADGKPALAADLREAFEASWERNAEGLRYLADR